MAKKRNIIVGQSGGPTSVINSSLAGVYKNAVERGFDKVYGMLHGIQGLLDEQYIDLSTQIHSELDIELLKRTPSAFLGSCRYKLPEIHEDRAIYEKIFDILNKLEIYAFIYIGGNDILVLIGVVLSLLASAKVKSTFARYSNVRSYSGMTGRDAAEKILHRNGIYDVQIIHISGNLTDHYNPTNKTLALSDPVYHSTSVAAIGVAAHESML